MNHSANIQMNMAMMNGMMMYNMCRMFVCEKI